MLCRLLVLLIDIILMQVSLPAISSSPVGRFDLLLGWTVKAIRALAVRAAFTPGLEALAVLLLALGVFARASVLVLCALALLLLLIFAEFCPLDGVGAIDAATLVRIASQPVFQAIAVTLRAVVLVAIALDLALTHGALGSLLLVSS